MTGGSQGLWSFPRRRLSCTIAYGVVACALGLSACGGGHPAARGFGSAEIEPIRDSTLVLEGESRPGVIIYGTGGPGGGVPRSADYWTLDLSTGAVQEYGAQFPPYPSSSPPPSPSPYACGAVANGSEPTFTLQIIDQSTGLETDIVNVLSYAQCPGADGTLIAFLLQPDGVTLTKGPYAQLKAVPLSLQLSDIEAWTFDPVTSLPLAAIVEAATADAPSQLGIYSIDLGSYAITPEIPAVPASVAWATGAMPAGSMQSTVVTGPIISIGDHYLYQRTMSDAGMTMFAGPLSSGAASELALFQIPSGGIRSAQGVTSSALTDGSFQSFSPLISWQLNGQTGAATDLIVWDDANRQVIACPSSPQTDMAGIRSSDGSKILFVTTQSCCQYLGSGPLSLLTFGNGPGNASCTSLAASNVVTAAFSPDGSAMFWLIQPTTGDTQLWVAAGDGSGAHMIGAGTLQNVHFVVPGEAQLELILNGDLVWLDLHDSRVQLHDIAEQVFEEIYDTGVGGWVITSYDYNSQDTTATLGLVNRNTGEKRPISPDVGEFIVLADSAGADGGLFPDSSGPVTGVLTVVYVVRGRNPSPQDGIWSATITTADLQ
jgi:hypothetical protein